MVTNRIINFLSFKFFLGKHAIFGRVESGLPTVNRIGLVSTGANDR